MRCSQPWQFQIAHEKGEIFNGDQLRDLPEPTPARDEIVPDPDSIPLTVLNYPLGTKHEVDFSAYEEKGAVPPSEEGHDIV